MQKEFLLLEHTPIILDISVERGHPTGLEKVAELQSVRSYIVLSVKQCVNCHNQSDFLLFIFVIVLGTTILDAIKEAVSDETEIIYEEKPSPETLARRDFSFAIFAVGEEPYVESFGDNLRGLAIPVEGVDIINSVSDNIPTLVILVSGRPLVFEPWLLEKIDALIAAWLPGSEGGGIADVVFGDHDFKGRLPVTWFKRVEQLPLHIGVNSYDPLFPLGFGLRYKEEKSMNLCRNSL